MSLTLEQLEQLTERGCQVPGCEHKGKGHAFYFHSRCCGSGAVEVGFQSGTNFLALFCPKCGRPVATVEVAPTPVENEQNPD